MKQIAIEGIESNFSVNEDVLRFRAKVCVPSVVGLTGKILVEAYSSLYVGHPRSVKMY